MSRRKPSDEPPNLPQFITGKRLSEITTYTDVHHREAAKKGYFNPPSGGLYETVSALQGLFKRERDLRAKGDGSLSSKRAQKLDKENIILEMDIMERRKEIVFLDDMDLRFRPLLVAVRQKVLASTLTDDEKDELITEFGDLLKNALTPNIKGSAGGTPAAMASDLDQAPTPDRQQVG